MASLSAKFFIFSLTLLLASSLIAECRRTSKQREFDYFVLALQWPGTICRGIRHCCSSNACCRGSGAPSEFTIHGLWTDYNDGTWPACCTNSRFDIKESLSQTMFIFLWYVAEKHGTCSSPVIHDEYNYFLTTLNVYFKYNVTKVLNEAGYIPSNSEKYPLGGIISAVENAFHASPLIVCSKGAIEELRLCFYKDFKVNLWSSVSYAEKRMDLMLDKLENLPGFISLGTVQPLLLGNIRWRAIQKVLAQSMSASQVEKQKTSSKTRKGKARELNYAKIKTEFSQGLNNFLNGPSLRSLAASVRARNLLNPVVAAPRPSTAALASTSSREASAPEVVAMAVLGLGMGAGGVCAAVDGATDSVMAEEEGIIDLKLEDSLERFLLAVERVYPYPEEKGDFKRILKEDKMDQEKNKVRAVEPEMIIRGLHHKLSFNGCMFLSHLVGQLDYNML
ncbi:hypothetical protein V2J09_018404 [Rumex salicifolius]